MLPQKNRLPAPEIRNVMRRGRRVSSGPLQLIVSPAASPTPRFSFIVSTSVDKRATVRNRMKRLLREAVQKLLPSLRNMDVVIMARKGLPDTQQEVDALVRDLIARSIL